LNFKVEKLLLGALISLLVISNSYWLINEYRSNNREKYEATYNCETKELIFSLKTFPIGLTYKEFKGIVKKSKLEFKKIWEKKEKYSLEIRDMFYTCPISRRPYCGITFEFEKDILKQIEIGYPCH